MKRVVVTGATGFIGRWSVPDLISRGYEVHAIGRRIRGGSGLPELAGSTCHAVDLFDGAAVAALFAELRPTHLLHFAWNAEPNGGYWTSLENYRWVAASLRLLHCFAEAGGERVVMAGTCAEYDWSAPSPLHEIKSPLACERGQRASCYSTTKIALQRLLESFERSAGLSSGWGRIFFSFGPHEQPERLVPSVIRALLEGRQARCTAGRQIRSFLHVSDVGRAFGALLDGAVRGPVNIGGEEAVAIAEVVTAIGGLLGRPDLIRLGALETPAGEPAVLLPALGRLRDEVGWKPRESWRSSLNQAVEWWRSDGIRRAATGPPPPT